jgi:hypothetical protein
VLGTAGIEGTARIAAAATATSIAPAEGPAADVGRNYRA